MFDNQESQLKKPNQLIKIIALNDCHKVSITTHKHQSNVFEIRTREAVHLLSTETYQQMQLWLNALRSVAFATDNNTSTSSQQSISPSLTTTMTDTTTTTQTNNISTSLSSSLGTIKQPLNSKSIPGAIKLTVNGPNKDRTTNGHRHEFISSSVSILPTDHHIGHQPQQEENMLYSSVDAPDLFSVKLIESESTIRCKLLPIDYYLLLTSVSISLAEQLPDTRQGKILWTWPYRHIRRYGCTKEGFSLEAGRKCLTGEGLFSFVTTDGSTIFKCVASHVTSLKTTSPNGIFPVPRTSPIQSTSCSTSSTLSSSATTVTCLSPLSPSGDGGSKSFTSVSIPPSVSLPSISTAMATTTTTTITPSTGPTNGSIICTARPMIINNEGVTVSNQMKQSTNSYNYSSHHNHQRSSSPKPPSLPKVPRPHQRESPTSACSNNHSSNFKQFTNSQSEKLRSTTTKNDKQATRQTDSGLIIVSNNNVNINGYSSAIKPPRRGRNCDDKQSTIISNHEGNSIETIAIPVTIVDPLYEDPIFVSREELFGLKVEDDNHYEIPVIVNNNQPSNLNNQGAINGDPINQITITTNHHATNESPENNNRKQQHNMKYNHNQQQQLTLVNGGNNKMASTEVTNTLINEKLPRIHPHSMSRLTSVIRSMFTGNLGGIVNPRSKQSVKLEKYHSQSSSSEGSYCSLSSGSGGSSGGGPAGGVVGSISLEKIKQHPSQSSSLSSTSSDANESPYSEICDIPIESSTNHHNQQNDENVIMMMMINDQDRSFTDDGNYVNLIPQFHHQKDQTKSTATSTPSPPTTTTIVTNINPDHYIQNDAEYALIMKRSVSCGKL